MHPSGMNPKAVAKVFKRGDDMKGLGLLLAMLLLRGRLGRTPFPAGQGRYAHLQPHVALRHLLTMKIVGLHRLLQLKQDVFIHQPGSAEDKRFASSLLSRRFNC